MKLVDIVGYNLNRIFKDLPPETPAAEPSEKFCYLPWKPPFVYNCEGQWIEDSCGSRVLDLRGWGYLTGKGSEALKLDEDRAAAIQDKLGAHVVKLLNQDAESGPTKT